MKRTLAALCFALVLPGLLAAQPATRPAPPSGPSMFMQAIGGFVSFLRAHWTIAPYDGGHDLPPPTLPTPGPSHSRTCL